MKKLAFTIFFGLWYTMSFGQLIGGGGIFKVIGNPNSLSILNVLKQTKDAIVAIDTTNGSTYVYDVREPIGSRWQPIRGANVNWGGYKITNLANGTASSDAINLGQADGRYGQLANVNTWTAINNFTNPIWIKGASAAQTAIGFQNVSTSIGMTGSVYNYTGNTADNSDFGDYVYGNNNYRLFTNGAERLRVTGSGNVGIGIISPTYKLDVNGGIQAANSLVAKGSLTGYSGAGVFLSYETYGGRLESYDYSTSSWKNIAISPNGGNVGIGTTTPISKLHVAISSATANYTTIGNINGGILVGVGADGTNQILNYATKGLMFGGNYNGTQTEQMRIDGNGNVGIGISSPTQKLHINGNMRFDGYLYGYQGRLIGGSDAGGAYFGGGGGTSSTLPTYIMADNAAIIFNNNSSERMRISSSGNVGIGIATPNYKLDVTGSVYSTQGFFTSSSSIGIQGDGTSLYLKSSGSTYLNTANNASISSSGVLTSTGITINGSGTIAGTLSINAATAANHAVTLSQLQDASNLTTGTIPDARLSSNIARVDNSSNLMVAGAFSGGNSFSSLSSSIDNYVISSYNSANSTNDHSIYLADLATNVNSKTVSIVNIANTSVATGAVIRIYPPSNYLMSLTKNTAYYELVLDAANTTTSDNFTGTNKWKVECMVIRSGSRCNCFLVKN